MPPQEFASPETLSDVPTHALAEAGGAPGWAGALPVGGPGGGGMIHFFRGFECLE